MKRLCTLFILLLCIVCSTSARAAMLVQQSTVRNLRFLMLDSTDRVTGLTGLSPTVTIAKDGAGFTSPSGAVTEIGNGWYQLAATTVDTNTLGQLIVHATATDADPADLLVEVVAFNPQDGAAGVWTYPTASMTTAGSSGKLVTDNINTTISSRGTSTLTSSDVTAAVPSAATVTAAIWSAVSRTLTANPGITSADVTAAVPSASTISSSVWSAVARTLTANPGLTSADVTAAVPSAATIASSVWGSGSRTLTANPGLTDSQVAAAVWGALTASYTAPNTFGSALGGGFGLSAADVWGYETRTLTSADSSDWTSGERLLILNSLRRILSQVSR